MSEGRRTLPISPNLRPPEQEIMSTIRLQFARKGSLIYIAHLDMLRLFERALFRSGLPFAASQGFNPRPLIVFALPVGIGVAVERDYADIVFYGDIDPALVAYRLNASFPEDLRIVSAVTVINYGKSIMAAVRRAEYVFIHEGISKAAESVLDSEVLHVRKTVSGKEKMIDIRPLIIELDYVSENRIRAVFSAGSKDNLRPDLFLKALSGNNGFTDKDILDTEIIRTAIFLESDGQETTK